MKHQASTDRTWCRSSSPLSVSPRSARLTSGPISADTACAARPWPNWCDKRWTWPETEAISRHIASTSPILLYRLKLAATGMKPFAEVIRTRCHSGVSRAFRALRRRIDSGKCLGLHDTQAGTPLQTRSPVAFTVNDPSINTIAGAIKGNIPRPEIRGNPCRESDTERKACAGRADARCQACHSPPVGAVALVSYRPALKVPRLRDDRVPSPGGGAPAEPSPKSNFRLILETFTKILNHRKETAKRMQQTSRSRP